MPRLYQKKFTIDRSRDLIATAGSCFAQHIGKALKSRGFNALDEEPAPAFLPSSLHQKFGYGMYSARYGNIYTIRQFVQLIDECSANYRPYDLVWTDNQGKYYDSIRPSVEEGGLDSIDEVFAHREYHLARVREVFRRMTIFVFTLGLTEAWSNQKSSTIYPTAPVVIAGSYDPDFHKLINFSYDSIMSDLNKAIDLLDHFRDGEPFKFILTVSPVPLTATACDRHVLLSTFHSKSTLRAAAGDFANQRPEVDYFPSYEIITNPWTDGNLYISNKRSVSESGVKRVMNVFFSEHDPRSVIANCNPELLSPKHEIDRSKSPSNIDIRCDEELLDAFGTN